MNLLSNHSIPTYFWAFCLALVLSVSSIQNISASVQSGKVNMVMDQHMIHQMKSASINNLHMTQTVITEQSNSHDCCDTNECASSQCTSATSAVITSKVNFDFSQTTNNIYRVRAIALTHVYPSSLYRPPKI